MEVQRRNGVDRRRRWRPRPSGEATKRLLSYFRGPVDPGSAPDQERLRDLVPERRSGENNVRPDHRDARRLRASRDLPARALRVRRWPPALARIEGLGAPKSPMTRATWPAPSTSDAADKAARFMQLCDAFGLPVLSLVDTPGMMVGPEGRGDRPRARHLAEAAGRPVAALRVPFLAGILRRGVRARRAGDGRRWTARAAPHARVADRPPRADGPRGRRPAPASARSSRRSPARPSASSASASSPGCRSSATRARSTPRRAPFEVDDVIDPAETRALIGRDPRRGAFSSGEDARLLRRHLVALGGLAPAALEREPPAVRLDQFGDRSLGPEVPHG